MPVVVVANPKGGVGKSTLATHVAGYYAAQGHEVMLGDADRQQSSRLWLRLRPNAARPISTWEVSPDLIVRPPRSATHVVIDTPAGRYLQQQGIAQKDFNSYVARRGNHCPARPGRDRAAPVPAARPGCAPASG